ncbi:hypothetical protein P3T36_006928 [Kitasatospora sp. MAP12-15]|nr:hypothetical protein [Kitasatospora sp. MAP12-44]
MGEGIPPSNRTAPCAKAPRSPNPPAWSTCRTCPGAPGSSSAANDPTQAPSSPCSTWTRACATRSSSPTPPAAKAPCNCWRSATARTPASKTASARCGKTTGFGRSPSRRFQINAAWLELSLAAVDLIAWTQTLFLDSEFATAEPKKLRYRLLHAAARVTRGARRLHLRIAATWLWRHDLATAFTRLQALAEPLLKSGYGRYLLGLLEEEGERWKSGS